MRLQRRGAVHLRVRGAARAGRGRGRRGGRRHGRPAAAAHVRAQPHQPARARAAAMCMLRVNIKFISCISKTALTIWI